MFTFTTDHYGRTIALCSDAQAVSLLASASREGWTEVADAAWGYSREYAPGHLVHTYALQLHNDAMAAGVTGYITALYHPSARNLTEHSTPAFVADRAQNLVVCNLPSFGYVPDPATSPCRFQG